MLVEKEVIASSLFCINLFVCFKNKNCSRELTTITFKNLAVCGKILYIAKLRIETLIIEALVF